MHRILLRLFAPQLHDYFDLNFALRRFQYEASLYPSDTVPVGDPSGIVVEIVSVVSHVTISGRPSPS